MDPVKEKSKEVQALLKQLVENEGAAVKHISAFGFKFDSGFWIAVETDAERDRLKSNRQLLDRLNSVFKESGYLKIIEDIWNQKINNPILTYLKTPGIEFESQETIDRDYKGSWYHRMK